MYGQRRPISFENCLLYTLGLYIVYLFLYPLCISFLWCNVNQVFFAYVALPASGFYMILFLIFDMILFVIFDILCVILMENKLELEFELEKVYYGFILTTCGTCLYHDPRLPARFLFLAAMTYKISR